MILWRSKVPTGSCPRRWRDTACHGRRRTLARAVAQAAAMRSGRALGHANLSRLFQAHVAAPAGGPFAFLFE